MKILYVDMDGVLVDFDNALEEAGKFDKSEIDEYVDHTPGLFLELEPIQGAIKAFEFLSKYFQTYILTTAPWKNTSSLTDKRIWVEKFLPIVGRKKLIITHRKDLNKGDYLIDDRQKHGVEKFEGEHIHFGSDKFPDWNAVISYLCKKEKITDSFSGM